MPPNCLHKVVLNLMKNSSLVFFWIAPLSIKSYTLRRWFVFRDIARVDSRLRDINRTIADHGRRSIDQLPPMPPPMSMNNRHQGGYHGGNHHQGGNSRNGGGGNHHQNHHQQQQQQPQHHHHNSNSSGGNGGVVSNNVIRSRGCTVFVRNLAYNITWQQLRERFGQCGKTLLFSFWRAFFALQSLFVRFFVCGYIKWPQVLVVLILDLNSQLNIQ